MADKRCTEEGMQASLLMTPKRGHPLAKIITGTFISIVVLFLFVLLLTHSRLANFHSLFAHITEESLPEMTYSKNIHNQANELLYFSSHLSGADNDVGLRIVKQEIDRTIALMKQQIIARDNNHYQLNQLQIITAELGRLYELVKRKRSIQKIFAEKQSELYKLHKEVFELSHQIAGQADSSIEHNEWALTYSEVITLAGNGLIKHKLQGVRQTLLLVKEKRESIEQEILSLPLNNAQQAQLLVSQLDLLLLDDDGLLPLKIELLRIAGLVTGLDNFVKNLVDDFLRVTEFKSSQINQKVIDDTRAIAERTKTDTKLITIVSIFVLLILFFIIAFIEKRFVNRLVLLNQNVWARVHGKSHQLDIKGNDEIAGVANVFNIFADKIEEQKQELHDLSLTDSLTGLANRRALDQRLEYDLQTAKRSEWPVAVLLMDIDFFKQYNDTYGHVAGDLCLQKVAAALARIQRRSTDFVARYGGEEFLFILPDTHFAGAQKVASKVLAEINALQIEHQTSDIASHVTLSLGGVIFHHQDKLDAKQLIEHADHALYKAKLSGKNCSCFY